MYFHCNIRYVILSDAYNKDVIYLSLYLSRLLDLQKIIHKLLPVAHLIEKNQPFEPGTRLIFSKFYLRHIFGEIFGEIKKKV